MTAKKAAKKKSAKKKQPARRATKRPAKRSAPAASGPKLQRFIDLIAALLRHQAIRFDEIARHVPAYAVAKSLDTVKRMFERDKDELRNAGVPIETVGDDGDEEMAYRIRAAEFYLPYLSVMSHRGRSEPRKVAKWGYRALATLTFEPDELRAVADAAQRVRTIGEPAVAADAESAMRKLAFDLPVDAIAAHDQSVLLPARTPSDPQILSKLADALLRRKRVTITYHSMTANSTESREVEPYGLFFIDAHWYLAAYDRAAGRVRNFRVSRVKSLDVNTAKAKTPDYEIPADFVLRNHARSRQAWELGDGDATAVTVRFSGDSGPVRAAMELGAQRGDDERVRQFSVRRADAFARWLLSFGGDAIPLDPPSMVDELRRIARRTAKVYA